MKNYTYLLVRYGTGTLKMHYDKLLQQDFYLAHSKSSILYSERRAKTEHFGL